MPHLRSLPRRVLRRSRRELSGVRRRAERAAHELERRRRDHRWRQEVAAERRFGTVVVPFGRYFASHADLLTRDGFKTTVPIDGVSPFTAAGDPDPELQERVGAGRTTDRASLDLAKDLGARLARADAHLLMVDNSAALLYHLERNGRLYSIVPGEESDLMDELWEHADPQARDGAFKVSHQGLTEDLKQRYDRFAGACLEAFAPDEILLVRSHVPRFLVAEDGSVGLSDLDRRDAHLLEQLDHYFVARTGCRVVDATLGYVPTAAPWQRSTGELRRAIEAQVLELCATFHDVGDTATGPAEWTSVAKTAADHVVGAARAGHGVESAWLRRYFAAGGASYDDLLALAYLDGQPDVDRELISTCIRAAVADPDSQPQRDTRRRFDGSVAALRRWRWCRVPGWRRRSLPRPDHPLWTPQIAVRCARVVLRFGADGTLRRTALERIEDADAEAIVDGERSVTPTNLTAVLGSWPVYLLRGRRKITSAIRVVVGDVDELIDSLGWLDWAEVLRDERVVITTEGAPVRAATGPRPGTDLSFVFDRRTRIGTVGGGLMDQVTHIALFDDLCRPHGLDLYVDDLRYIWWRSHNGFEASRLAPRLERRRLTRLVSQPLLESFRDQVTKVRLPWLYSQSQAWYDLGLTDALVVTFDYFNARRLEEMHPVFPLQIYGERSDLAELIRQPPRPVCFYTTQQRIGITPSSATALRRVFSYRHLEKAGLDPAVAETAALLRATPHVALHIRRGDYLNPHFDGQGWHTRQDHYVAAIDHLIETELGTDRFDLAVFSDDLDFVREHAGDYGIDKITGSVHFVHGNNHYKAIFDSYLMAQCPVIVGSVGFFAATTSLLADAPSTFIRTKGEGVVVNWRR